MNQGTLFSDNAILVRVEKMDESSRTSEKKPLGLEIGNEDFSIIGAALLENMM